MFARVTVVEGQPEKVDAGVEAFEGLVVPTAKGVEGYKGALLLVDRRAGNAIGMTLWESEEARRMGAEAVAEARQSTLDAMGGGGALPAEYEVAVADFNL